MNKIVYIAWHLLASIFIFGIGGLCFSYMPNTTMYFFSIVFLLLCVWGVLLLSLCSLDAKKDQQRLPPKLIKK